MEKIITIEDLKNRITFLEERKEEENILLKEELHLSYESLKPINLIKSVINEATTSGVGLVAGFFSKKAIEGESKNPFKKLIGNVVMFGITNLIAKHPETIKSIGNTIINAVNSLKKSTSKADDE